MQVYTIIYFIAINFLVFSHCKKVKIHVRIFVLESICIFHPLFTIVGEGSGEIGSDVTEALTGPSASMAKTRGGTDDTGIYHNIFFSKEHLVFNDCENC